MEETYMKILGNVKSKLAKYLEPLLHVPQLDKFHWYFYLLLDPRYVNEFTNVRALHEIDSSETMSIVLEIMPNFYDQIVAEKLAENPYTAPPSMTKTN